MAKTSVATEVQQPCHLLALPPELRNNIYEAIFSSNHPTLDILDIGLASVYAPNPAITTTCAQIQHETRGLFQRALALFWHTRTLHLHLNFANAPANLIKAQLSELLLCAAVPRQIQRLEIYIDNLQTPNTHIVLTSTGGGKGYLGAHAREHYPRGYGHKFSAGRAMKLESIAKSHGFALFSADGGGGVDLGGVARLLLCWIPWHLVAIV